MDTASIDIQRPRSPFQNISGYGGFRKRLAGEDDGLAGGLEGGAPAFPLAGGIGGWDVRSQFVITMFHGFFNPRPGRAHHTVASAAGCFRVAWVTVSNFLALYSRRSINPLAHAVRLGKAPAVDPHDGIADIEARILDGTSHAMIGSCTPESDEVSSWLERAVNLCPHLRLKCDVTAIPCFAHEAARNQSRITVASIADSF